MSLYTIWHHDSWHEVVNKNNMAHVRTKLNWIEQNEGRHWILNIYIYIDIDIRIDIHMVQYPVCDHYRHHNHQSSQYTIILFLCGHIIPRTNRPSYSQSYLKDHRHTLLTQPWRQRHERSVPYFSEQPVHSMAWCMINNETVFGWIVSAFSAPKICTVDAGCLVRFINDPACEMSLAPTNRHQFPHKNG